MHRVLLSSALAMAICAIPLSAQANVLLVVLDDLGPDYIACYQQNAQPPATPTLDQLANSGLRFTAAYADPVCTPTRACLATGRHAFRSGVVVTCNIGDPGMRDEEVTLPEALSASGYARALVGKWHIGDRHGSITPNVQGWPHFAGSLYGNIPSHYQWTQTRDGVPRAMTTYSTTAEVDEALSWIGQQTQSWMLMLNFHAPHTPLEAPPAHLHTQNLAGLSPSTSPVPFYKAMVEALDRELGRLLTGLGPARANTNIVVIGDNGTPGAVALASSNRAKGSLYQGGVQVPLLIQGPAVSNGGRVVADRVHAVDVLPTVLELCGLSPANHPVALDGRSLLPLLLAQPLPPRPVYAETIGTGFGSGYQVIDGDYKLIRFSDDVAMLPHEELYNVRLDPSETNDLLPSGPSDPAAQSAYQNLTTAAWQLRAQGFVLAYADDCPSSQGSVRLKSYAPPALGTAHHMRVLSPGVGANSVVFPAMVMLGNSNSSWLGSPLPYPLDSIGMPGCVLSASPDFPIYIGTTNTLFWVWVPNDLAFLGQSFYSQAAVADPAANPAGLATSAGYHFTLGF
ncbi:MAG: sulfatase-like hydrolase/transferase [Planctomycetota bacterium]